MQVHYFDNLGARYFFRSTLLFHREYIIVQQGVYSIKSVPLPESIFLKPFASSTEHPESFRLVLEVVFIVF